MTKQTMHHNLILGLLILLALLPLGACAPAESPPASGFIEPEPADYVQLAPVVWEYFYHRKDAVLSGNLNAFYVRYPDLAAGADPEQGINDEAFHVAAYQGFDLLDGDAFPAYYEPIRIKTLPDQVQILVHGLELYLYVDEAGHFSQTGGEFKIILTLQPDGEGWTIYHTDEVTLAEWKDFSP